MFDILEKGNMFMGVFKVYKLDEVYSFKCWCFDSSEVQCKKRKWWGVVLKDSKCVHGAVREVFRAGTYPTETEIFLDRSLSEDGEYLLGFIEPSTDMVLHEMARILAEYS